MSNRRKISPKGRPKGIDLLNNHTPVTASPAGRSPGRKTTRKPPRKKGLGSGGEPSSTAQKESPSYTLAYEDADLLQRDALRPVRIQLEMWKSDLILREHGVRSTVAIFGSSRIVERKKARRALARAEEELRRDPDNAHLVKRVDAARRLLEKSLYYDEARRLARIISSRCQRGSCREFVIATGGGPGIMEAANRGAHDVKAASIGLNINLPFEQAPNPYITPSLCFQFRYFAIRKMHFLMRAKALVAFPGGYGTFDEFFDIITLIQTGKAKPVPVVLFGSEFWNRAIDFQFLSDEGTISPEDLHLFRMVDTAEDAWRVIRTFYGVRR